MDIHVQKKVSLSKNIFFVLLASLSRHGLSIFSGILVARILFPQDFGIISMATTFTGLVDVCSRLGFEAFIISRRDISPKEINTVYLLNILTGIISAIVIILGAPLTAHIYKTPEVKYILIFSSMIFLVNAITSIPRSILIREMQQKFVSKLDIFQGFLNTTLVIVFALLGFRYLSYVIPLLIANLIVCIVYLKTTKWEFSKTFDKSILNQAVKYSKSFLPKTILSYFVYNSDYIFIGCLLGPTLLGYYFFGFSKASVLLGVLVGLHCNIFLPLFSKFQTNEQELKKNFFSIVEKQNFILYPLIFTEIILAKELLNIIYGTRWDNSILTFQLILGYTFLRTIASVIHVLFDAVNMPQQNLKHFMLVTPMCIAAFWIGINIGGLKGVSIAAFIVHSFATILLFIRTCLVFKWDLKEFALTSLKCFVPLLLQLPIIIPLKIYLNHLNLPDLAILIIILPIIISLYLLFTVLFLRDFFKQVVIPLSQNLFLKIKERLIFSS